MKVNNIDTVMFALGMKIGKKEGTDRIFTMLKEKTTSWFLLNELYINESKTTHISFQTAIFT